MIRTSEFLRAFREPDEALHLRAFRPRNAPETAENNALLWNTSLADLTSNRELQKTLITANGTRGIYFAPNVGGSTDASITRFTAWFVESDSLPIAEQHQRFDAAAIQPSIRVETRKSVHGHFLIADVCNAEEWADIQLRLIHAFNGDPKIINPSRVMRLPNFDHIYINGDGPERRKVTIHTFEPDRRYTVAQMREAFPKPEPEYHPPALTSGSFEYHEDRHGELCQRISSRGKRNSKGNWDARGICHNGTGEKGLVYFPASGAVVCNNNPKCDYFAILRAEALPDGHLPSRESVTRNGNNSSDTQPAKDAILDILRMSDVEREEVEWLWYPYIAIGKLTLLEGDPGIGKSWITGALACAVSRGHGLPGTGAFEPGNVLMLSAEDGLADTLRPRLDAVGADVTRVLALNQPLTFDEKGLLSLEAALIDYTPRLLTVDPLFAFTGGKVDIHRANECRTITARLAMIAEKHGCAIVAVRHLGKSRGMGHALNAGIGSIDLVAAARSVLLAGKDPDNENKRAIAQIKSNLAPNGPAIGFALEGGQFFWTGESDLTAERILSYAPSENERPALDEAAEFLRGELDEGECDVKTLTGNARAAGVSEVTLRRAKRTLGIQARKVGGGFGGKGAKWFWYLPDAQGDHHAPQDDQKIDDDRLVANHDDKSTYSNGLAQDDHGHDLDHLVESDDHLVGHYREPTKEEWAAAAKDPEEWRRLAGEAEGAS